MSSIALIAFTWNRTIRGTANFYQLKLLREIATKKKKEKQQQ